MGFFSFFIISLRLPAINLRQFYYLLATLMANPQKARVENANSC
jgi:hypothetical protein